MYDYTTYRYYRLWLFILIIFSGLIFSFGYVKSEYSTFRYNKYLSADLICTEFNSISTLKYYKILYFTEIGRKAEIYCIFDQPASNVKLILEKQNKWQVVYSELLNKDSFIYYPFYI